MAGPRRLTDYLASVAAGERDAPDLIAVGVRSGPSGAVAGTDAAEVDTFLPAPSAQAAARAGMTGRAGDTAQAFATLGSLPVPVLLLGLGDGSPRALRAAGAALGRRVGAGRTVITAAVFDEADEAVHAFAEGLQLGSYTFEAPSAAPPRRAARRRGPLAETPGPEAGTATGDGGGMARLLLAAPASRSAALRRATVIADAVALARDLANMPSDRKTPAWLADQAAALAPGAGLAARVWNEGDLVAEGFGGLLAVGSGSARPPRLIQLSYEPPVAAPAHIVLVGKGITFDSGGLSLKPSDGMKLMKTDMAGAAAVLAVMSALTRLGVTVRVTALVAAAESMPSGSAMRPGDVITHYGGRTVEVLNTDAEGRLVLADALAYADAALDPDAVVDLATLTGAARVALGAGLGALYATDDQLAGALLAAGMASGDPLWRMPLAREYRGGLDSPVADLANVAGEGAGRRPGSIDAALFLREFTGGRRWAHLDIAGAARAGADEAEITRGATGFGVRVLLRWLAGGPAGGMPSGPLGGRARQPA